MSMVVDFHSHILPRLDDGSRSVEESVAMLRMSAEQGIREIVLTPHFYPQRHTPERFLEKRAYACYRLWEQAHMIPGLPDLKIGAEVHYFSQMSHSEELEKLAIEGTSCILVEMPSSPWTEGMYRELAMIPENLGLRPIIAHVDRYLGRFRDYGIPKRLSELPVLVQANANFFLNDSRAMTMLRNHQIHVLGSDCHNMAERKPNLGPAIDRIVSKLGPDALEWIKGKEREIFRTGGNGSL